MSYTPFYWAMALKKKMTLRRRLADNREARKRPLSQAAIIRRIKEEHAPLLAELERREK